MEPITLAHCHRYYRQADRQALHFLRQQRLLDSLQAARFRHVAKYRHWFDRMPESHVPLLISVPCHLATALIEALVAAPLFYMLFEGLVAPGTAHGLASYLPLFTFLGVTLAVGYNLHRYRRRADSIDPDLVHADSGALWTGLGLAALYVIFLVLLMATARELLHSNDFAPYMIIAFGLAELALGYFAASGWAILYAYGMLRWIRFRTAIVRNRMHRHAHYCEEKYNYYVTAMHLVGHVHPRLSDPRINLRIRQALDYYQVQTRPEHNVASEDVLTSAA